MSDPDVHVVFQAPNTKGSSSRERTIATPDSGDKTEGQLIYEVVLNRRGCSKPEAFCNGVGIPVSVGYIDGTPMVWEDAVTPATL